MWASSLGLALCAAWRTTTTVWIRWAGDWTDLIKTCKNKWNKKDLLISFDEASEDGN